MSAPEQEYIAQLMAVTQRHIGAANQISAGYRELQARLDLPAIFEAPGLGSATGRAQSRDKLATLRQANEAYKTFCAAFLTNWTRDILNASADLPENLRQTYVEQLRGQLQAYLNEESGFQHWRAVWLDATQGMLELFEGKPAPARWDEAGLAFESAQASAQFDSYAAQIDDAAEQENRIIATRVARMQQGAAAMGMRAK